MSEEEMYEVDGIVSHREVDGHLEFLIRWKNFPDSENTWETEEKMNCPQLLSSYMEAHRLIPVSPREPGFVTFTTKDAYEARKILEEKPERVIAVFKLKGRVFYRVAFKDGTFGSVDSRILRFATPDLICNYLMKFIKFKD